MFEVLNIKCEECGQVKKSERGRGKGEGKRESERKVRGRERGRKGKGEGEEKGEEKGEADQGKGNQRAVCLLLVCDSSTC